MDVDGGDEHEGLSIYRRLLRVLLRAFDSSSQSYEVLHYAAQLFTHRDAVLAVLRGETGSDRVPEAFLRAAAEVRAQLAETSPSLLSRPEVLKGKRVFGHKQATKFISLPNLPASSSGCSVFVPRSSPADDSEANLLNLAALHVEQSGAALVMSLEEIQPGARVIFSPMFRTAELAAEAAAPGKAIEAITQLLGSDDVWKSCLRSNGDFFTEASHQLAAAVWATPQTGKEPKDSKDNSTAKSTGLITPRKPSRPGGCAPSPPAPPSDARDEVLASPVGEEAAEAYGKLLAAMCQEFDLFADEEKSWLEGKKQLLVYQHAARLAEERDRVVAAIKGDEVGAAGLDERYRRVVDAKRTELVADLAAHGLKAKRLFSHEQVIRFHHPPKGLNVPRSSCIFLRERPQSSGDGHTRKRPSIFCDFVRFRSAGNPLTQMENHGLALVLHVEDKSPKAFLVISPLFEHPEIVDRASSGTWQEIETSLQDHLSSFIVRESDAWLSFIRRHANIVSKDSLRIIQKALKGCKPSPSKSIQDVQPSGLAEMEMLQKRLEKEAIAKAEAEARCAAAEALLAAEVKESRCRSLAEAALEVSRGENCLLMDANHELLHSLARAHRVAAVRKQSLETLRLKLDRLPVLKQELKAQMRLVREATKTNDAMRTQVKQATALAAADRAGTLAAQDSMKDASMANHEALKQALAGEAKQRAALEIKAATIRKLTASNVQLRAEAALKAEAAAAAKREAASCREASSKLQRDLGDCKEREVQLQNACEELRRECAAFKLQADKANAEAARSGAEHAEARSGEVRARAEFIAKGSEANIMASACAELRVQVAKLEAECSTAGKTAQEATAELSKLKADVEVKASALQQLSASNVALRAATAEADGELRSLASKLRSSEERESQFRQQLKEKAADTELFQRKHDLLKAEAEAAVEAKLRAQQEELVAQLRSDAETAKKHELKARAAMQVQLAEVERLTAVCSQLQAGAKSCTELELKAQELCKLQSAHEVLQTAKAEADSRLRDVSAEAEEAKSAATEAHEAKSLVRRARAELHVQVKEVARLLNYSAGLMAKAEAAERQLREMQVSLQASDLNEADVAMLVQQGSSGSAEAKAQEAVAVVISEEELWQQVWAAVEERPAAAARDWRKVTARRVATPARAGQREEKRLRLTRKTAEKPSEVQLQPAVKRMRIFGKASH